jgi:membrane-associated phospholipid phosphatase
MNTEQQTQEKQAEPLIRDYQFRKRILLLVSSLGGIAVILLALPDETRRRLLTGLFEQRLLITLLASFNLLMLSLLWSAGQRLDSILVLYFHIYGYRAAWLDKVLFVVTQLGNGISGLLIATLAYFLGHRRLGIALILGTLALWIVVEGIKLLTYRPRPFWVFEDTVIVGWKERGRSFPSGHTAQVFFLLGVLNNYLNPGIIFGTLLYFLAILVAFSRVYIGQHYPRDVLAGAILGSVFGILGTLFQAYLLGGPV